MDQSIPRISGCRTAIRMKDLSGSIKPYSLCELDKIYFNRLKEVLGEYKMDSLKSDKGEDYYGLFHESFSPLPLHVDSGFNEETIIYKQVITPLIGPGETIFFKKRWYGKSTTFTIDKNSSMKSAGEVLLDSLKMGDNIQGSLVRDATGKYKIIHTIDGIPTKTELNLDATTSKLLDDFINENPDNYGINTHEKWRKLIALSTQ